MASSSSSEQSDSSSSSVIDVGLCDGFDPNAEVKHYDKMKKQICDERDGKKYVYVSIGTQTWMAENLNYDADGSECYVNEPNNCDKYGRLYDWETAKIACPLGWHLPTNEEWHTLVSITGDNLKAENEWSKPGRDSYGFSALPGGYKDGNEFKEAYDSGYWWSSTGSSHNENAIFIKITIEGARINNDSNDKNFSLSVRCVKDKSN